MSVVSRLREGCSVVLGMLAMWAVSAQAQPVITNVSPAFGNRGQAGINIRGQNFSGGTLSVKFNGVTATASQTAGNLIVATVPNSASTGPISVTFGGLTHSTTNPFVVLQGQPYITRFSPQTGQTNTEVSLYGVNLAATDKVWFGGVLATGAQATGPAVGQLRVRVPAGAVPGPITISNNLSAIHGTYTTISNFFPFGAGPQISSFDPVRGTPGTQVRIIGNNFYPGATSVRFGTNVATTVDVTSGTQLFTVVPANASNGPISVVTPFGTNTTSTNFLVGSEPVISRFTPSFGPVGQQVVIDGDNFITNGTTVRLNGTNVASVSVVSKTQLRVVVQNNASSGVFTIGTAFGTNSSASNFVVTGGAPHVSSFDPPIGTAGTLVLINGGNFLDVTNVQFGGVRSLAFQATAPTQITAVVPAGALNGPLKLINPYGSFTTSSNFYLPPVISSLNPTSAPVGATVTVRGTNLSFATELRFNGLPSAFTVLSNQAIQATVPAGATNGFVTVITPGGTAASPFVFPVLPSADLSVRLAADRNPIALAELGAYSATVTNPGPDTASNVVLSIDLPFFMTLAKVQASAGVVSSNATRATTTVASLARSNTLTLTVVGRANSTEAGVMEATVVSTTSDLVLSNNSVEFFVLGQNPPNLRIAQTNVDQVLLSWPVEWSNFVVQAAETMPSGGSWTNLGLPQSVLSNRWHLSRPATNPEQYFRLMRPSPQ